MDMSDTIAPKSDQLDAVDLLTGPRIFTIKAAKVDKTKEQPVDIWLEEFPRVWRPGLSMRRVLVACWGGDSQQYVGRRVELYCDNSVQFGGKAVGGTRIKRLSHLDRKKQVALIVSKGRSEIYTVEPLPDAPKAKKAPAVDYRAAIDKALDSDECRAIWKQAAGAGALTDDLRAAITGRVGELEKADEPEPDDGFLPSGEAG